MADFSQPNIELLIQRPSKEIVLLKLGIQLALGCAFMPPRPFGPQNPRLENVFWANEPFNLLKILKHPLEPLTQCPSTTILYDHYGCPTTLTSLPKYGPIYSAISGWKRGFRPDPNGTTDSIYVIEACGTFPGPIWTWPILSIPNFTELNLSSCYVTAEGIQETNLDICSFWQSYWARKAEIGPDLLKHDMGDLPSTPRGLAKVCITYCQPFFGSKTEKKLKKCPKTAQNMFFGNCEWCDRPNLVVSSLYLWMHCNTNLIWKTWVKIARPAVASRDNVFRAKMNIRRISMTRYLWLSIFGLVCLMHPNRCWKLHASC